MSLKTWSGAKWGVSKAEQSSWRLCLPCREGALLASISKPPRPLVRVIPFHPSACGRGVVSPLCPPPPGLHAGERPHSQNSAS